MVDKLLAVYVALAHNSHIVLLDAHYPGTQHIVLSSQCLYSCLRCWMSRIGPTQQIGRTRSSSTGIVCTNGSSLTGAQGGKFACEPVDMALALGFECILELDLLLFELLQLST